MMVVSPSRPKFVHFHKSYTDNQVLKRVPLKSFMDGRYVEYVFVQVKSVEQLETFKYLMMDNSELRFTYELSILGKLPFLAASVEASQGAFQRSVYDRKRMISSPSAEDLASVLCSVAAALGSHRVNFLLAGESGLDINVSIPLKILRAAKRRCLVKEIMLGQLSSSAETYSGSYLSTSIVESMEELYIVNKAMQKLRLRLFSWIIFCNKALIDDAFTILPWTLDNKVLLLVPEEKGFSAWDAYRVGPSAAAVPQSVSALSVPPLPEQLDELRREPWSRRDNLTGLVVRGSVLEYKPYTIISEVENRGWKVTGMAGELWEMLQDRLSFKMTFAKPEDGLWGNLDDTSSLWSGVLGELQNGKADASIAPFVFSQERARSFDFSVQVKTIKQILLHQTPSALSEGSNYTQQFNTSSWLAVGISFLTSVYVIKTINLRTFSWSDSVMKSIRIFCNMGYGERTPHRLSHRLWLMGNMCTIILLHVYYTAFLIATLSADAHKLPVKDLNDIYQRRGEYTLGLLKDTVQVEDFRFARDPLIANLWRDVVSQDPFSLADLDTQVARTLTNKKHVFVTESSSYPKDCQLTVLPTSFFKRGLHFPVRRDFPALPIINYRLQKLVEGGITEQLYSKWSAALQKDAQCISGGQQALGLAETHTGFYPIALGAVAACALLLAERLLYRISLGRLVRVKTPEKFQNLCGRRDAYRVTQSARLYSS